MVATVQIHEKNGTGEVSTDKTSITVRFKNADDKEVDTNDRLVVPTSLREYSFRKVLRTRITVAPDVDLQNLRFYSDGSNGFGTGIKVWYAITPSYTQGAVPSEANDPPQFPGTTAMADFFGLVSGTPGDLDASSANPGPHTGTGDKGDYMNLVMEVETTAAPGQLTPTETLTVAFDET